MDEPKKRSSRLSGGVEKYVNPKLKRRIIDGAEPPWLQRHKRRAYIVSAVLSAPPYVCASQFADLRQCMRDLSRIMGEPYVLDHIIPVSHKYVCGLTVPWNIQVIPHRVNVAKSNSFAPDQIALDLVVIPEQLCLLGDK